MEHRENVISQGDIETHWRANLAVMSVAQFMAGVGFSIFFPFLPFYFRELGLKTDRDVLLWMGYVSIAFGITMSFSAPLWGLVADRYGRKLMVIRSMIAGAVVLGFMGLATNPWHILILRILQGMTTGTITASVTMVSSVTPIENLGLSLGILQTALLMGNVIGPLAGGVLADLFGYRLSCGIAFVMLLSGAVLVIFGAKERFVRPSGKRENGFRTIQGILRTEGFIVILAVFFLVYVLNTLIIPILPLFIEELSGNGEKVATLTGVIIGMTGLFSGISAAYFGRLGDRLGHGRILFLSLVAAGIISLPQALANTVWVLFIERCLLGLAVGGVMPSVNTLVSNIISRERVGSAYGLTSSVTCLGIGMGPFLGGSMAAVVGLRWPFAAMGMLALIMAFGVRRFAKAPVKSIRGGEQAGVVYPSIGQEID
jgi:DHA1 family multidrug resistance protein-like MFS transporter